METRLLRKIFLLLMFIAFSCFSAQAQIKYSKRSGKSRPQHSGCAYIGVSKNQKVKFSKALKKSYAKHLAEVTAKSKNRPRKGEKKAVDASILSSSSGVVHTASSSVSAGSSATTATSKSISGTSSTSSTSTISTTSAGKKDSLKAVSTVKPIAEKVEWYTSSKPIAPQIEAAKFNTDEDELTAVELSALKIAEKNMRYGYKVNLVEYIPNSDLEKGKNTTYKRLNKIKSQLIKMGANPDKIYLKTCDEDKKPVGERFIAIELVD